MSASNSLESVYFMTLPENFSFSKNAFPLDTTIPLPVQKKQKDDPDSFNTKDISEEQILAGILTVLAYDRHNPHLDYYRSIIKKVRPNIEKEINEAAIIKTRNEEWDLAEELFMVLKGIDPENTATILNTALFLDQRGSYYRNSGLIDDADAYDNDALNYYKIAMNAEPPVVEAFFNAGFFYLKHHEYKNAREAFETYLALTFDDKNEDENSSYRKERAQELVSKISSEKLDNEYFEKAYTLLTEDKNEEGLDCIREYLQKNPKSWNAWFICGWGLRKLKRFSDAEQSFIQAEKCGGTESADLYNELAICQIELNKLKEAQKSLMKAFALEPENIKIISNLGYLNLKLGKKDEAQKFFTSVLEYSPNDPIALHELKKLEESEG